MEIRKFDEDLNIIQALDDEPNDSEGLSASELKAKFDEAGLTIQGYINDSLIPDVKEKILTDVAGAVVGNLPEGAVSSDYLAEGAVTTEKLAEGAVRDAVIAVESIGTKKLKNWRYLISWQLIDEFLTPGPHVWQVPDLYNDGGDYQILVRIIGGGGSGATAKWLTATTVSGSSGGCAGQARNKYLTVSPGESYNLVVGEGGSDVSTGAGTAGRGVLGNAGGSSAFNGISVDGGSGGTYQSDGNLSENPSRGGQIYDYPDKNMNTVAPSMGTISHRYGELDVRSFSPGDCENPANGQKTLGAGGSVSRHNGNVVLCQESPILDDGLKAGEGSWHLHDSETGIIRGVSGTSPGSGGGGIEMYKEATGWPTSVTARSGEGAGGAVYIYARYED